MCERIRRELALAGVFATKAPPGKVVLDWVLYKGQECAQQVLLHEILEDGRILRAELRYTPVGGGRYVITDCGIEGRYSISACRIDER